MKKLLAIGFALALGACAAQQNAVQSSATPAAEQQAAPQEKAAAARDRKDEDYVTSLERRDVTGSRINRVRRTGEVDEDTTAGKRVETLSREEIEMMDQRTRGPILSGEE